MSRISPKLIDVEGNRIGDYIENRKDNDAIDSVINFRCVKNIASRKVGRFPTQLFTNIKNDRFKYVKRINI